MKKIKYENPSMKVIKVQQHQILCSSPKPWGSQDPDNPYDAGAPALFDAPEWDALLGE